jgi:hypothetical protein
MIAVRDEDLPRKFDKLLEKLGWEIKDIRDFGLRGKSDEKSLLKNAEPFYFLPIEIFQMSSNIHQKIIMES